MNAMAAKTIVKASLPSLHDKLYPSLELCVPQAISEDSTFAIAIINVVFIIIIIIIIIIINEFTRQSMRKWMIEYKIQNGVRFFLKA